MMSSINILEHSITREKLKRTRPDIYIDVDVDRFHILEFYKPAEILKAAEPAKQALKVQLARVLASEPAEAVETPPALPAKPGRPRLKAGRGLFRRKAES
jgi:predicted acylesterase/phospholipase RssA